MGMTYGEAKKVLGAFTEEYMLRKSWADYIVSCGLTYHFVVEWLRCGAEEGKHLEAIRAELIVAGEDPDEWRLCVGLKGELPEEFPLPEVYRGVGVFVQVVGEVQARG